MMHLFRFEILDGHTGMRGATLRYGLLNRLARSARRRTVQVLAFGIREEEVWVLLQGPRSTAQKVIRGVKSGTHRAAHNAGVPLMWGDTHIIPVQPQDLCRVVVACHRDPAFTKPLANRWTSHRDLLGLRRASFYDAGPLRELVHPLVVHRAVGGSPLPKVARESVRASLDTILKTSAAVIGVSPADRRCFGLFVHTGRALGWSNRALAKALMLTERRIRQLARRDEPLLDVALVHLQDPRLAA